MNPSTRGGRRGQKPVQADPSRIAIEYSVAGKMVLLPAPIVVDVTPALAFNEGQLVAPAVVARIVVKETDIRAVAFHTVGFAPKLPCRARSSGNVNVILMERMRLRLVGVNR